MPLLKRPREVIDLTGDDYQTHQSKNPRLAEPLGSASSSRGHLPGRSGQPSVQVPPGSAPIPSSSRRIGGSQVVPTYDGEPEVLDLTQSDDGPARELYGSLGTVYSIPTILRMLTNK
jgi:SWI/SNF-related matrix-associated actin-dependent regulator of chromatin subfamily A3